MSDRFAGFRYGPSWLRDMLRQRIEAKDQHVHDSGSCCECGSPYHCCCVCPVFRNGSTAGLTETDREWLRNRSAT